MPRKPIRREAVPEMETLRADKAMLVARQRDLMAYCRDLERQIRVLIDAAAIERRVIAQTVSGAPR